MSEWYHSKKRLGPISEEEVQDRISKGEFDGYTKVAEGSGKLVSLYKTELFKFIPQKEVNDNLMWGLASMIFISTIIDIAAGIDTSGVAGGLGMFLAALDFKKLVNSGQTPPSIWTILIFPVYIWQRTNVLKKSKNIFYTWLILFIVSMALTIGYEDTNVSNEVIAEQACVVVTQIMNESGNKNACKEVVIEKTLTDSTYQGNATLVNGHNMDIGIKIVGDNILVEIYK